MKKNLFDPHKSFIKLPIFRATMTISLGLAAASALAIYSNSNLSPDYSYTGFNLALTIYKLPLGLLAATIPVIALLAANHKSEQTREQMRLASINNNFTNYYKHTSEFESYFEKHYKIETIAIESLRGLHKICFPNSKIGGYQASEELIYDTKEILKDITSYKGSQDEKDERIQRETQDQENKIKELRKASYEEEAKKANLATELDNIKNKIGLSEITDSTEKSKEINTITNAIQKAEEKLKNLLNQINEISNEIQETKSIIHKEYAEVTPKIVKSIESLAEKIGATKITEETSNDQSKKIFSTPHLNSSQIFKELAGIIYIIDTSLKFDESYKTPNELKIFLRHFKTQSKTTEFDEQYKKYNSEITKE